MSIKLLLALFKNFETQTDIFCHFNYYHVRKNNSYYCVIWNMNSKCWAFSIPIWMSWSEVLNLLTQSCSCLCQEISCQNWGQFDQEMGLSEITKSSKKMEKIKKGSLTHNCTKVSMKSNWNFSLFVCLLTCYCECLYRMINESPCCRLLPFTSLSNIPVAKRSLVLKQLTVANRYMSRLVSGHQ